MPTKWLLERHNGSKNDTGIGFEGPGVDSTEWTGKKSLIFALVVSSFGSSCTERIFVEIRTSDRKPKASREGSK